MHPSLASLEQACELRNFTTHLCPLQFLSHNAISQGFATNFTEVHGVRVRRNQEAARARAGE
eukprot:4362420-Amphidinium_carterae.1